MKRIETWFWRVPDDLNPKRTFVTRFRMSEAEALRRYPTAVKAGGYMVQEKPETDAELDALHTSNFLRGGQVRSATPAAAPSPGPDTPPLPAPGRP